MRNNIYTNASQIYTLTEIREGVIRLCGKAEKMCSLAKFQFNFSVCIYLFPCVSKDTKVWKEETECEVKRSKNKRHTQYSTTPIAVKL